VDNMKKATNKLCYMETWNIMRIIMIMIMIMEQVAYTSAT